MLGTAMFGYKSYAAKLLNGRAEVGLSSPF